MIFNFNFQLSWFWYILLASRISSSHHKNVRWCNIIENCDQFPIKKISSNKNTLTGPENYKKTTRHYAHLSLCAKSRKTKFLSRSNIFKLQIFLRNRFYSNWRKHLVLTSRQKLKKMVRAVFEKNIKVSDFGLVWRPFREYLQIKNFFQKSGSVTFLPL